MARIVRPTAYGSPDALGVIEVPIPDPAPGQVVVQVKAAGVNPIDWKLYSGAFHQVDDKHRDGDPEGAVKRMALGAAVPRPSAPATAERGDGTTSRRDRSEAADIAQSLLGRGPSTCERTVFGAYPLPGGVVESAEVAQLIEEITISDEEGDGPLCAAQLIREPRFGERDTAGPRAPS